MWASMPKALGNDCPNCGHKLGNIPLYYILAFYSFVVHRQYLKSLYSFIMLLFFTFMILL